MNEERVKLFIAELRSGNYIQGANLLTYKNSDERIERNCCLGVACKVAIANGLEISIGRVVTDCGYEVTYDGFATALPESVQNWYGFQSGSPLLSLNNIEVDFEGTPVDISTKENATILNDIYKLSFKTIADAFEYTYLSQSSK